MELSGIAYEEEPFSYTDEYLFWIHQMGEHAFFLYLALSDYAIEDEGFQELRERGLQFYHDVEPEEGILNPQVGPEFSEVNTWLDQLKEWKIQVKEAILASDWLGFGFPSVIDHYLLELDFYRAKLEEAITGERVISVEDEIAFWTKIAADHAATIARLLDPKEREYYKQLNHLNDQLFELGQSNDELDLFIQLSQQHQEELNDIFQDVYVGIENKDILSIIHPMLLAHIIREGKRAELALEQLSQL